MKYRRTSVKLGLIPVLFTCILFINKNLFIVLRIYRCIALLGMENTNENG